MKENVTVREVAGQVQAIRLWFLLVDFVLQILVFPGLQVPLETAIEPPSFMKVPGSVLFTWFASHSAFTALLTCAVARSSC